MKRISTLTAFVVVGAIGTGTCAASKVDQPSRELETLVRTFVQQYVNDGSEPELENSYATAYVDLNRDRTPEVIVYLYGRAWCGSGGCTMLVLQRQGSTIRVISKVTIVQLPIRVLDDVTNGWHDLGVWVQGGGIQPGYAAQLSFDGKTYPTNPSTPPAGKAPANGRGEIVISRTTPMVSLGRHR